MCLDPSERKVLQLKRYLVLFIHVVAGAITLGICFVSVLLLTRVPAADVNLFQKTLIVLIGLSLGTSAVCWASTIRFWPAAASDAGKSDVERRKWSRRARTGWLCGVLSLGLLTASLLLSR
jgi:hypothetical protein